MLLGLMRVKNEFRWLPRTLPALQAAVATAWLFDDHSTDGTPELAESLGANVIRSPFDGFNEVRDKSFLLSESRKHCPEARWAVMVDGDEELLPDSREKLAQMTQSRIHDAFLLRIIYLWNDEHTVRVDGIYGRFLRPSVFRITSGGMMWRSVRRSGSDPNLGLHCTNVPQESLRRIGDGDLAALHYGYIDAELRRKKFEWYNAVDPRNRAEDGYRHVIQGDPGGPLAKEKLVHAGPLRLEHYES